MATVIETKEGWMIRCPVEKHTYHVFPKVGRPGASWTFNGDMEKPTFRPSMNELVNGPGKHHNESCPTWRCHFTVTDGMIEYHGDCTHDLVGKTLPLEHWPPERVEEYRLLKEFGQW